MELSRVQPDVFKVCVAHDLWLYPAERELRIGERAPEVDSLFISSELWQWPRNKGRIKRLSMAVKWRLTTVKQPLTVKWPLTAVNGR